MVCTATRRSHPRIADKTGTVVHCHSVRFLHAPYLNITPPEMVSVYGNGKVSVSPSSMVTNTEYVSSPFLC